MKRTCLIALLLTGCGSAKPAARPTATPTPTMIRPSPTAFVPQPDSSVPPLDDDREYRRPYIGGLEVALRYRTKLSDGRDTPDDVRMFIDAVDTCQHERIPRHAQMLSCTYRLRETMARLERKYRRDSTVLAVFRDLVLMGD